MIEPKRIKWSYNSKYRQLEGIIDDYKIADIMLSVDTESVVRCRTCILKMNKHFFQDDTPTHGIPLEGEKVILLAKSQAQNYYNKWLSSFYKDGFYHSIFIEMLKRLPPQLVVYQEHTAEEMIEELCVDSMESRRYMAYLLRLSQNLLVEFTKEQNIPQLMKL